MFRYTFAHFIAKSIHSTTQIIEERVALRSAVNASVVPWHDATSAWRLVLKSVTKW